MNTEENRERTYKYLQNILSVSEKKAFENDLIQDKDLQKELLIQKSLKTVLNDWDEIDDLPLISPEKRKETLQMLENYKPSNKPRFLWLKYLKMGGILLILILSIVIGKGLFFSNQNPQTTIVNKDTLPQLNTEVISNDTNKLLPLDTAITKTNQPQKTNNNHILSTNQDSIQVILKQEFYTQKLQEYKQTVIQLKKCKEAHQESDFVEIHIYEGKKWAWQKIGKEQSIVLDKEILLLEQKLKEIKQLLIACNQ